MNRSASHHRTILTICFTAALLSGISFAQIHVPPTTSATVPCKPPPAPITPPTQPCPAKHHSDTSISLGVFSELTIDRTSELYGYTQQGTAPSTGTLGTFRQTFSAWLGYSVNLGYARVSEQYRNPTAYYNLSNVNIDADMYESSLTYIAHTPVNKRFSIFADVGPGLSTFLPAHRGAEAINYFPFQAGSLVPSVQVRPTGVFGSGIDIHLNRRFDLRTEYRGLVYNNPDFRTGDTLSKKLTLTSEPTFSLVYHFRPQPLFPAHR